MRWTSCLFVSENYDMEIVCVRSWVEDLIESVYITFSLDLHFLPTPTYHYLQQMKTARCDSCLYFLCTN
jgi:hypothetical protein